MPGHPAPQPPKGGARWAWIAPPLGGWGQGRLQKAKRRLFSTTHSFGEHC